MNFCDDDHFNFLIKNMKAFYFVNIMNLQRKYFFYKKSRYNESNCMKEGKDDEFASITK